MPSKAERALPELTASNAAFWTGGAQHELRLGRCTPCDRILHPSVVLCPACLGDVDERVSVRGQGVVVAVTQNSQQWPHAPEPPYLIAIVSLLDAPAVRLTTNLVNCAPEACRVGLPVRVVFERHEDVWLPFFEPDDGASVVNTVRLADVPRPKARSSGSRDNFEHKASITGVGASAIGRHLARGDTLLTADACRHAVADAGLELAQIDGVCAYPGTSGLPGLSRGGARDVMRLLGVEPAWHNGAAETPGQTGAIAAAMLAVAAGLCRHVLCFTSVSQAQRPLAPTLPNGRVGGEMQWQLPFGAASPANWIALNASHYMARFPMLRETLGWVAISARRHAARNPEALHRDPLSMDNYLAAREISSPFGLFDCDVPCDGAWAVVVSSTETAHDLRQPAIRVDAIGTAISEPQSWDQGTLTHQPNVFSAAAHLWSRSRFTQADVDVALLYDGFTFNALCWLEALGFCGVGEASSFVEGGRRIGPGGELPLNPHGGQLACGRANGFGHVIEAVRQLRGHAGARQIANAKVAVCSSGGGIPAGCMLLHRDH